MPEKYKAGNNEPGEMILEMLSHVYITEIQDNERAMKAEELEKLFSIPVTKFTNLKELMQKLPDLVTNKENPCVIFGSLYLLSEFYALYPEKLQLSY